MNQWLDNIAADLTPLSTEKVARAKPPEGVDAYWDAAGKKVVETATFDGKGDFNTMYPVHSEPRLVAGAPLTNDVLKCQLKPINYAEYKTTFSVAQKTGMAAIFPSGVCDFSPSRQESWNSFSLRSAPQRSFASSSKCLHRSSVSPRRISAATRILGTLTGSGPPRSRSRSPSVPSPAARRPRPSRWMP